MSGLNHYAYANSNPIRYTDPTGLTWWEDKGYDSYSSWLNEQVSNWNDWVNTWCGGGGGYDGGHPPSERLEGSYYYDGLVDLANHIKNDAPAHIVGFNPYYDHGGTNNLPSIDYSCYNNNNNITNNYYSPGGTNTLPSISYSNVPMGTLTPNNWRNGNTQDLKSQNITKSKGVDEYRSNLLNIVNNTTYTVLGFAEAGVGILAMLGGGAMAGAEGASKGQILTGGSVAFGGFITFLDGISAIIKGSLSFIDIDINTLTDEMINAGAYLIYDLTGNYIDSNSFNRARDMNQHISNGASWLAGEIYDFFKK